MQVVVYVDVLIFMNAVITLILLLMTSEVFSVDAKKVNYILGSIVGGFFSLIIMAPEMGIWLTLITRIAICVVIILLTFRFQSIKMFFKCFFGFLFVSFVFAGIMFAISCYSNGKFIVYKNGYTYFNFSIITLIVCCAVSFLVIKVINRKLFLRHSDDLIFEINIEHNNKTVKTFAYFDSGNFVTDVFTGKSVIIVDVDELAQLFDVEVFMNIKNYLLKNKDYEIPEKMRLIPAKALGETKMIPAFTCDRVTVSDKNTIKIIERPVIGITYKMFEQFDYKALINEAVMGKVI